MDSIIQHVIAVSGKTAFLAPEAFVYTDKRFEVWHMSFLQGCDTTISPIQVMLRLESEGIRKKNIQTFLYWWWVHCEVIGTPLSRETKKVLRDYMNGKSLRAR